MSGGQLQLKELLTKEATELFPSLTTILEAYKNCKEFEGRIMKKVDASYQSKQIFEEQGKQLRQKFKLAFQNLDQEIDRTICQISQKDRTKLRERQKSLKHSDQQQLSMKTNKTRENNSKSCEKEISKPKGYEGKYEHMDKEMTTNEQFKDCFLTQTEQSTKENKGNTSITNLNLKEELQLICKKEEKPLQIYSCFTCVRKYQQNAMWQKQLPYLAHMRQQHRIEPQFDKLATNCDLLVCSHAFFRGKLINLLNNIENQQLKRLYYYVSKKKYEEIYFCACKLTAKGFAIMSTAQDFYCHLLAHKSQNSHLRHLTHKQLESGSHRIVMKGKFATLQVNKQFKLQDVQTNYRITLERIKQQYSKQLSSFSYLDMLSLDRLNLLELLSCNKRLKQQLTLQNIFHQFPYCQRCKLYFQTPNIFYNHNRRKHPGATQNKASLEYTLKKIQKFGANTTEYRNLELRPIDSITEKQQQILKAQIWLMRSQRGVFRKNAAFICAECSTLFKATCHLEYIDHIYHQHTQFNPLNSHYFTFLQQKAAFRQAEPS